MSWHKSTLGDLGRVVTGKTPSRARPDYFGDEHPFVKPSDFGFRHYYCTDGAEGVSEFGFEKHRNQTVPRDAAMCVCIGNTIGKCAIASEHCLTNQQINSVIANENNEPKFIYYLLCDMREQIRAVGLGGGAAQPIINKSKFSALEVQIPSLRTQQAIAEVLSSYDALIENNRQRIALLEESARLIYRAWFVHFRYPGHEHVRIIDGIPEGWKRRYLRDVVTTQYGHTASASDVEIGPKFLRGMDINKRSFIDWAVVPYCPHQGLAFEKYALVPGDILVIRMADPGKVGLVEKSIHAVFASYLVRFKIRNPEEFPPIYLFMTLMEDRYQGFIRSSSGGSTRKSASAKLLTDFHFVQPPRFLLELFIGQVAPMREMITKLVDLSTRAAQARDLLLPRLMNAEIAV